MESQGQNGNAPASGAAAAADPEITTSPPNPAGPAATATATPPSPGQDQQAELVQAQSAHSHPDQQKLQEPDQQAAPPQQHQPQQRGAKTKSGLGRASSRAGRPSSSSSSDSTTTTSRNKIDSPRSRSQSHAHPQPYHTSSTPPPPPSPPPADMPSSTVSPSQQASSQRQTPGRRRARTLESPAKPELQVDDDAKVKGGHSLRKRARIDYAQMNEDPDDERLLIKADDDDEPQASSAAVPAASTRSARKQKAASSVVEEDSEKRPSQPQSSADVDPDPTADGAGAGALSKKRAPRVVDQQRPASPVPQRRSHAKRKSVTHAAATSSSPAKPLPGQKPSTENGSEVDATPASSQSSENGKTRPAQGVKAPAEASDESLPKEAIKEAIADEPEAGKEMTPEEAAAITKSTIAGGSKPIKSVSRLEPQSPAADGTQEKLQDPSSPIQSQLDTVAESELQSPPRITRASNNRKPAVDQSPARNPPGNGLQATQTPRKFSNYHNNDRTHDNLNSSPQGLSSSPSSIDSDATEIVPPTEFKKNIITSSEVQSQSVVTQPPRVTLRRTKQPTLSQPKQKHDSKMASQQDTQQSKAQPHPHLTRNRRRTIVSGAVDPVDDVSDSPDEAPPAASPSKKGKGRAVDTANPEVAKETPAAASSAVSKGSGRAAEPASPDTPKKRGPGRPPKVRQSIEQRELPTASKPKERRVSGAATRIEQPRPISPRPPRDFSFLTPYLQDQDKQFYPEANATSMAITPQETPVPRNGSEEAQQQPDNGEGPSNAPTPAGLYMAASAVQSAASSRNVSPEPGIESTQKSNNKQYGYFRMRSPSEFKAILDDASNLSDVDLYNICEMTWATLNAWENEWRKEKLICEDEDNAVRRRAHDAATEAREARDLSKTNRRGRITTEKEFEVKGMRAERAKRNAHLYPKANPEAYLRMQDQIAAQAYGFEYDPRANMVGRQNPEEQRNGLQNTRLRNRPKLSQRAAEAAGGDEGLDGLPAKRVTRKPQALSEESKDVSRAATPAEAPAGRRPRRKKNELMEAGENGASEPVGQLPPPTLPKKRGPKPKAVKEAEARLAQQQVRDQLLRETAAAVARNELTMEDLMDDVDQPEVSSRKRRRGVGGAAAAEVQARDIPTASIEDPSQPQGGYGYAQVQGDAVAAAQDEEPAGKRRRVGRKPAAQAVAVAGESSNTMPAQSGGDATQPAEPVRPSTSSSTSSMHTVESSYSFRTRKRKNYSDLADPIREATDEPRAKRGRKPKTQQQQLEQPTSYPSNMMEPMGYDRSHPYYGSQQPVTHGYHHQQPSSVLAPPNNSPFVAPGMPSSTGSLLAAPSRLPGPSVGANPFSAPSHHQHQHQHQFTIEPPLAPPAQPPSPPRRKPVKIKLTNNRRTQSATPFSDFHGQTGYEYHQQMFNGGPMPQTMPGAGPGQAMFPVNEQRADSRGGPGSSRATPVPSSAASSTGGGQGGEDALSEKDYASMTKSEKMSASMKARWANGSMRQAVNKRKETLARKKQKQADDKTDTTPTPQPESAPPTAPMSLSAEPRESILPPPPPRRRGSRAEHEPAKHKRRSISPPQQHPYMNQPPNLPDDHPLMNYNHPLHGFHDPYQYGPVVFKFPSDAPPPPPPNPFLDHGYVDTHPRLPFSASGASSLVEPDRLAREREREQRERQRDRGFEWLG